MAIAEVEYLSPPTIARQLGIALAKVHGWIRRGEILAVDLCAVPNGRPRWRVHRDQLDAFLRRRSNATTGSGDQPRRRRPRTPDHIIEYF